MLEKITAIRKVGLFREYVHSPGSEFGGVSLVFGENGVGKSTLSAILDSLRAGNPTEILRRVSLPGDADPEVELVVSGQSYVFAGHGWDRRPPEDTLEVFCPGFVSKNVHAAVAVDSDQRRNLCEFVLGSDAVEKVERLAAADEDARKALAEIKRIEKDLSLLIKRPDTLQTFLGLSHDPDIDSKLVSARADLLQAQSRDALLRRSVPMTVKLPTVEAEVIAELLVRVFPNIAEADVHQIEDHIKAVLDDDGEAWLAYGARHLTHGFCPLCAQDLHGSPIIDAISRYFGNQYSAYADQVSVECDNLAERYSNSTFQRLKSELAAQFTVAEQWRREVPTDQEWRIEVLDTSEDRWFAGSASLRGLLRRKQQKPLSPVPPEAYARTLEDLNNGLLGLETQNARLSEYRSLVEARVAALESADISRLQDQINHLENQKVRFEPLAQELLSQRNDQLKERQRLEDEKRTLKSTIDRSAAAVVDKYQDGINFYLQLFGTDIRIEGLEPRFPSGKASVQYKLRAHGHEVPLGFSADTPCFDTVLSEGDKYSLALSFFLARLKLVDDLSNRCVVLDDPVNSFGSARRIMVGSIVRDLRRRGAQVIVFTHDERLAAIIWRDQRVKDIVALQVQRVGSASKLLPWDIEAETRTDYVRNFLALAEFLESGGDYAKVSRCIRPYVEQRLRHLFPGPPFSSRDSLGHMIAKVRDSTAAQRIHQLKEILPELELINEAGLPGHHATDDVPGLDPLTPEQVRVFAIKALEVLK